jgi:hypothetical protein
MFLKFFKQKRLYCFTPEVMIATFVIEIALAIYVFVRYKSKKFNLIVGATLVFLATFQLSEYLICRGVNEILWMKIGFIAITFLPVFGLHLISIIYRKSPILKLGYFMAGVLILIFMSKDLVSPYCGGNYIIFELNSISYYGYYPIYYFGLLFFGIKESLLGIKHHKNNLKKRKILMWLIVSYLTVLLPTFVLYSFFKTSLLQFPLVSVTCGFAVIYAFILATKMVSIYNK